jgi:hypothetical protein
MVSQVVLATLEELVACFDELEDPRSEINRKHPLASVVAIRMGSTENLVVGFRLISG